MRSGAFSPEDVEESRTFAGYAAIALAALLATWSQNLPYFTGAHLALEVVEVVLRSPRLRVVFRIRGDVDVEPVA